MTWIKRVEAEYGQPIEDLIQRELAAAHETGTSLTMLASDLGCSEEQLRYFCYCIGVRWPRVYSQRRRDACKVAIQKQANAKKYDVNGVTMTANDMAAITGLTPSAIRWRLRSGVSPENVIRIPKATGFRGRSIKSMQGIATDAF